LDSNAAFNEQLNAKSDEKSEIKEYNLKNLLKNKIYLVNLLSLNLAWSAASFTYYMVGFYIKYIPGDIYTNVIVAGIAEALITLQSGFTANKIGTKLTLVLSFAMGGIFGILLIFIPEQNVYLIMLCVLLTKAGVSSAFNICYLVT